MTNTRRAPAWLADRRHAVLVAVVLVAGWLPLTELGVVATIAFTTVTLAFAYVQYLGVRRLA